MKICVYVSNCEGTGAVASTTYDLPLRTENLSVKNISLIIEKCAELCVDQFAKYTQQNS